MKRQDFFTNFLLLENCDKYCLDPEPELEPEPEQEPEPELKLFQSRILNTDLE